jgi:hypothetical protein
MARRDELLELLRPPAHRGPLIAAGAVLFTAGIVLEELRLDEAVALGVHLLILALSTALLYGLGVQAKLEGGRPLAYQSVLLVCGLLLLAVTLLRLADVLGADGLGSGTVVWISLVVCGAAVYPAMRRNSAICTMIAGLAAGAAVLAAANWIFGVESQTAYRWILLGLTLVFVLASLVLRGGNPRHAELMVITGGLATFAIAALAIVTTVAAALTPFPDGDDQVLPAFWDFVVLAAGCGLIAYGAVDRVPGAAWLGVAHLAGFLWATSAGADDTLLWWPLILLALGGGAMAVGLRPRQPLPPEPDGYSVERPLASRSEEELVVRVRNDEPPPR